MQLYMFWYIRSFFGFTFLNIIYFFKYSRTNIFHRRSLYTFYKFRPGSLSVSINLVLTENILSIHVAMTAYILDHSDT